MKSAANLLRNIKYAYRTVKRFVWIVFRNTDVAGKVIMKRTALLLLLMVAIMAGCMRSGSKSAPDGDTRVITDIAGCYKKNRSFFSWQPGFAA